MIKRNESDVGDVVFEILAYMGWLQSVSITYVSETLIRKMKSISGLTFETSYRFNFLIILLLPDD